MAQEVGAPPRPHIRARCSWSCHRGRGWWQLPQPLTDLFDWIDEQGWSRPGRDGASWLGSPYPLDQWPISGTLATFEVETPTAREQWIDSYLGVPGYSDRLVSFARTGHDGSYAAFWSDDSGAQRIVHMGSGSGSVLTCLLGRTPQDFLRLLAIGYPEICWLDARSYAQAPDPDTAADGTAVDSVNQPLREWLTRHGLTIPETAAEVMDRPAFMDDGQDSHDPFCRWLAEVTS